MFNGNFKMAIAALRSVKWRSLLTMIGIIIGVVSVVITVSLGEGIKHQVIGQIDKLGSDLITIRPGKIVERDSRGRITKVNIVAGYNFSGNTLPAKDLNIIAETGGVKDVVPVSLVGSGAQVNGHQYTEGSIIGTSAGLPDVLKQKIQFGDFFSADESNQPVAVIGHSLAFKLFQEEAPIGQSFNIHGQTFVVRGVFDAFDASPLTIGPDFNNSIFIPYSEAQQLSGGNSPLNEVLVKPKQPSVLTSTINNLNANLLDAHGGQSDFTILRQDENLAVTSDIFNLLTAFIAAIASISLLVSGIGIMNIMLVSVTERTKEIGIRKAVGATNRQILGQFLVEALMLSFGGALIGFLLSLLAVVGIRIATHLQPVITWPIVAIAAALTIIVGVLFGLMPAVKAATKDPIDALRYE